MKVSENPLNVWLWVSRPVGANVETAELSLFVAVTKPETWGRSGASAWVTR